MFLFDHRGMASFNYMLTKLAIRSRLRKSGIISRLPVMFARHAIVSTYIGARKRPQLCMEILSILSGIIHNQEHIISKSGSKIVQKWSLQNPSDAVIEEMYATYPVSCLSAPHSTITDRAYSSSEMCSSGVWSRFESPGPYTTAGHCQTGATILRSAVPVL